MPPCNVCQNPTLCTERCHAYAQQLEECAKSGQMDSSQVAAHVEAGEMPADQARDWPEDFEHENGMYMNRCSTCGEIFLGYKRRVTCKVCAERMLPETANAGWEAGEMEAAKGDELCTGNRASCLNPMCDAQACLATPLPTHPQQEKS